MQLDSLTLSEIWLYSSSQVGNFGGRRISTESRRSRLLPAERGCEGVPTAGAVLGQCWGRARAPLPTARAPLPMAPLPGTGTGSMETMLGTASAAGLLEKAALPHPAGPWLGHGAQGQGCGVHWKERGQDFGSCCPQECTADAKLVQLSPREHVGSVPGSSYSTAWIAAKAGKGRVRNYFHLYFVDFATGNNCKIHIFTVV